MNLIFCCSLSTVAAKRSKEQLGGKHLTYLGIAHRPRIKALLSPDEQICVLKPCSGSANKGQYICVCITFTYHISMKSVNMRFHMCIHYVHIHRCAYGHVYTYMPRHTCEGVLILSASTSRSQPKAQPWDLIKAAVQWTWLEFRALYVVKEFLLWVSLCVCIFF